MAREKILWIAVIALAAFLIFGGFHLFKQNEEIKGLRQSKELIDEFLENEKDKNFHIIDSLNKESKKELIKVKTSVIDSLTKVFEANKSKPKYDTSIDKITDSDSINKLYAKTYPQETVPKQKLEAVRNAQRVEVLQTDLSLAVVIISSQKSVIEDLQSETGRLETIISLTDQNYKILQSQYDALKKEKNPSYKFSDFIQDVGKVLIGVVVGVGMVLIL